MKFGVIPPYARAPVDDGEFAAAFAQVAEEHGFESVWVVEHVVMAVEYDSVYPYDPSGRSPSSKRAASSARSCSGNSQACLNRSITSMRVSLPQRRVQGSLGAGVAHRIRSARGYLWAYAAHLGRFLTRGSRSLGAGSSVYAGTSSWD